MASFLETVLLSDSNSAARDSAAQSLDSLRSLAGRGDRTVVARAERTVAASPASCFRLQPDGSSRLQCDAGSWAAGRFDTPSLRDLEFALSEGSGELRFFVMDGASPLTDIGWLQASAPQSAFFQVASQFNCLEAPGPSIVPVARYFSDGTQGPRATIGAFPGTLLRHYFAPTASGGRFTQVSGGPEIDLLANALGETGVHGGYLTGTGIDDAQAYAGELESNWLDLRVGIHEGLEVVFGGNWDGGLPEDAPSRIGQALTSTVSGGLYGADRLMGPEGFRAIARQLLRAGYYGTILGAARAQARWVCLTLIGGGVFGNPIDLIFEAIVWALDRAEGRLPDDMVVILNGRDLRRRLDINQVVLPEVRRREGLIVSFGETGLVGRVA